MKIFTLAFTLISVIFGGLLWLMKPDRVVEIADSEGTVTVSVYGQTIHVDSGPAGYKHVFYDRNSSKLKTTLVTGIPRRGLMLTFTKESNARETRIWHAVFK